MITPTKVDGLSKVYYNKGKGCDDQQKPKKKKKSVGSAVLRLVHGTL